MTIHPNMIAFWSEVLEKIFVRTEQKLHKITQNSMKNIGSHLIFTNLVRVYPRDIHTKFEPVSYNGFGEVQNVKLHIYIVTVMHCKYA